VNPKEATLTRLNKANAAVDSTRNRASDEESPVVGVPDRDGVRRAFCNGHSIRRVMDAWGLDYQTAKAIRDEFMTAARHADRRRSYTALLTTGTLTGTS
jgi:hypothetical protein